MKKKRLRATLSKPGLLDVARLCFEKIEDTVSGRRFALADYLMSGLAVFSLKYPSLLAFEEAADDGKICSNLGSLYKVSEVPSDSSLRKRLDELDPTTLRAESSSLKVLRRLRGSISSRRSRKAVSDGTLSTPNRFERLAGIVPSPRAAT